MMTKTMMIMMIVMKNLLISAYAIPPRMALWEPQFYDNYDDYDDLILIG